jgi:putative ABC transport system ATP-binding protein
MIQLSRVTKTYKEGDRDHVVLDAVDVEVAVDEWVALLGPSGSGKTTLLNLVSGIDLPDAGEVHVGGLTLNDLSERERTLFRRKSIGFVFQSFNLLPTLTVEENLLLPLELVGRDVRAERPALRGLLDEVGLADRLGTFPDRLSTGERQRVAIARALIHDPSVVLADEPTGNLDAATGARVMDLMERMLRDRSKTVLTVTHSDELAARADRVLELRGGHIRTR